MPEANGNTHKKSIVVPCTVKIRLNVLASSITCTPGRKSSVLIEIASNPPMKNRVNEKIMYSKPISV
jgi:hypothetical protein